MSFYASVVQDGEEIAQLVAGYPVGPLGSTVNAGAFTFDFAVPGQELQIKAENNDDLADGRLSVVVYGSE